jgi:uncharacterized membrane protein
MSIGTILFLILRPLHVLLAATWIGATIFTTYVLMPAIDDSGPAGGQVMAGLDRKGMVPFFASVAGITVLSGIYLFWRFTGGFDPEVSRSHAGMAFGIGGIAGIVAAIIGGSVVGRASKQAGAIMAQLVRMPDGPEKTAQLGRVGALKQRMSTSGKLVLALQVVALVLMALGHYI